MRTADVFVVLWVSRFQGELLGELVAVAAQDRADLFEAAQPLAVGDTAGGVESLGRVFAAEIQQAETEAVGLLGMILGLELRLTQSSTSGPIALAQFFNRPGVHCWCLRWRSGMWPGAVVVPGQ